MTTVRELGELGLIDHLTRIVANARLQMPEAGGFRLVLGIGDDAAAWHTDAGVLVNTTDTMVEGVHFTPSTASWSDVGWKAMASNLSDVAAMGAVPLCAIVTLGLPGETPVSAVDALYAGMLEACHRYQLLLVGGDVVSCPTSFVSLALTGLCPGEPMVRSRARPGDAIAVTGPLGGPAGGLRLLQSGSPLHGSPAQALVRAHQHPEPRLDDGQRLVRSGIRCAMDVSDGLVTDLSKLCRANGVGAHVQAALVPVHSGLAQLLPNDALQMALNGGEEYELLFTGDPSAVQHVISEMPRCTVIGEVTADGPGHVTVTSSDGRELAVASSGWEHWRS